MQSLLSSLSKYNNLEEEKLNPQNANYEKDYILQKESVNY